MQINLKLLAVITAIPLLLKKKNNSTVRESSQRWQETHLLGTKGI